MSDAKGPDDDRPDPSSGEADTALSRRLRDLDRQIGAKRSAREESEGAKEPDRSGYGLALRLGADFVAGVVVGAAIGWGIDALAGTSPWGLAVFLILGFAAGVLSVMRSAGLVAKRPGLDDDPVIRRMD
ncbi:MAG: AtpZ/AtpI family protein [Bauldia sp.]|nr:AtpZ/AtpI family protein [Bauldia sp.]